MPNSDLTAWLGPAADELTPEQLDLVALQSRRIDEQYPDPDEQPERDAALSAVVQYILGETTPDDVRQALVDARLAAARAYAAAVAVAVTLVDGGTKKAPAAQAVGVDRMSLLKALGER